MASIHVNFGECKFYLQLLYDTFLGSCLKLHTHNVYNYSIHAYNNYCYFYVHNIIFVLLYFDEKAAANVERAIIKAMERQYHDILAPLRDSIPKRLGIQVQKLARRQSTAYYSIPTQVISHVQETISTLA